jgi:uncharacterized protein YutE (UPF0331/DUF86 family)
VTDAPLVLHKLRRLAEQIALLRQRRPAGPEVLATDLLLRDGIALALLVACQEVVDVAYHVVADEGWGVPSSHADALALLAQHGVIDGATAASVSGVVRARNRIAHGYASVDHARLWAELPDGIAHLERFSREVARWLPVDPK